MTTLGDLGISHLQIKPHLVAFFRFNLKDREEILTAIQELVNEIPTELIAGDPYCHIQYFSSYPEGYEAEVGFPITSEYKCARIQSKITLPMEVLSIRHRGPQDTLRETKQILNQFTREHALISDEFTREVYPDWQNHLGEIEVQFVIHDWNSLFEQHLGLVLGSEIKAQTLEGISRINLESNPEERFSWAKEVITRLECLADKAQRYDVVSSCAHVFPPGQLEKLHKVFQDARGKTDQPLDAVDAVLAFMAADPGWGEKGTYRDGNIIYHTKNLFDPEAYEKAETEADKRAAYCYCPVVRTRLEQGMPVTYCLCGAGWYRQQWEAATGKPVRVGVARSLLKGDDRCSFSVRLSDDI
jgi:effector-binding domain-containing protein